MKIPPNVPADAAVFGQSPTRNTKVAALLYSLEEATPALDTQNRLMALRLKEGEQEVCWFFFQPGPLVDMVQTAFNTQGWEAQHAAPIPDEYVPAVISLIKTMWHNWERLKDATKGMPLHLVKRKDGKIYIAAAPGENHGRC